MKYIVIDLEMNSIPRKSEAYEICKLETIEIGAVMLDDNIQEISTFSTYVKPEYNNMIEKKISKLTGITYEMVVTAPTFNEALRMFTDWCLGTEDELMIYAWSKSDYVQISKEMVLKEYDISEQEGPILNNTWSDFQKEFDSYLGFKRPLSLKVALDMAGVSFSGREHDALDDARNTAELLQVFKDEKLFELTLSKIQEVMQPKSLVSTIGDLIDLSKFACV